MIKKIRGKVNLFIGKFLSGEEKKGVAAWEILLACLFGLLVLVGVITAVNGSLPTLWQGLVTKFKSTLGI